MQPDSPVSCCLKNYPKGYLSLNISEFTFSYPEEERMEKMTSPVIKGRESERHIWKGAEGGKEELQFR